jgi:DNA recombination protein RmuC
MQTVLFIIVGIVFGVIAAWLIAKYKYEGQKGISKEELDDKYVSREFYDELKEKSEQKENQITTLSIKSAKSEQENQHLKDRLKEQKEEIERIQQSFRIEFENLANKLLDEKSKKFLEINEKSVGDILKPLREKIQEFEKKVDETYKEETRERISLKKELERILELNKQVSEDADKLTKALKGDTKIQGSWGEDILEMILEKAGLTKNVHYRKQETLRDESGRIQRPDYIINLPDDKNLILDSKVSLTAYVEYYNCEDEPKRAQYLSAHLNSINKHINELSNKNYQALYEINSPDYVLMFVPNEPALNLALREDIRLFEKALDKNIVLVSVSTLLATLRTISYIWKQENQRKNVFEIARQSGKLYDKFVGFIDDLTGLGKKLDDAKSSYNDAMNKLVKSTKKGDTIVGRIESIKRLGADAAKSIPQNILDRIEENELLEQDDNNSNDATKT